MLTNIKEQSALQLVTEQLSLAKNPIVLCSFGKDSLVLLHLCLRVRKVPVIFFRFSKFPEKYTYAANIIKLWDLESYDFWPYVVHEYQSGTLFEIVHSYSTGSKGFIHLFTGLRSRLETDSRYFCAIEDLLLRPKAQSIDYPWDVTFHGQKGSDDPELGTASTITKPVVQVGGTRVVIPLTDWADVDIWDYIHKYNLPYNQQRYDAKDETANSDKYPTCFRCIDTTLRGQDIYCPKYEKTIQNIAKPESAHDTFRELLLNTLHYCEVTGEPRSTPYDHSP